MLLAVFHKLLQLILTRQLAGGNHMSMSFQTVAESQTAAVSPYAEQVESTVHSERPAKLRPTLLNLFESWVFVLSSQ